MLLVFERNGQALEVELTYDHESSAFVVVVEKATGERQTERFPDLCELRDWLLEFELTLVDEHWEQVDPPFRVVDPPPSDRVM